MVTQLWIEGIVVTVLKNTPRKTASSHHVTSSSV